MLKYLSPMFTAYLFNNFKSFALLQKMFIFAGIVDGVLMAFLPLLSVASIFSIQKILCIYFCGTLSAR